MQFSGKEVESVLSMGLTGLVCFGLYQVGTVYFYQSTDEVKLSVETDELHKHPEFMHLFVQLDQRKEVDVAAFTDAVNLTDDLLAQVSQIQKGVVVPTMADMLEAQTFKNTADRQVVRMYRSSRSQGNPRRAAELLRIREKLYPLLVRAYTSVQRSLHR
jgi:hypothetical protein